MGAPWRLRTGDPKPCSELYDSALPCSCGGSPAAPSRVGVPGSSSRAGCWSAEAKADSDGIMSCIGNALGAAAPELRWPLVVLW